MDLSRNAGKAFASLGTLEEDAAFDEHKFAQNLLCIYSCPALLRFFAGR